MDRKIGLLLLILSICVCSEGAVFAPISDRHRSAALELFAPSEDGSFGGFQEMYEALRTFQILGIEPNTETKQSSCHLLSESLDPSSAKIDELFYALKAKSIGHCQIGSAILEEIKLRLQSIVKDASSLSDYYYAVGGLVSIKEESHENNNLLADASGVFRSIKSLSQSDGRWRYNSDGAESSTYAAGMAFSALAGVISLASSEIEESMIDNVKGDIIKLFGSLESYDDGVLYFDEKLVDATYNYGPLSTTSSVIRGVAAFTAVTSGKLNIPGEKLLGLANFFLSIGIPGSGSDLYLQLDSLAVLDNNRISIPLILSLPASVLSLTSKDQLKVKVSRVFGSEAPPLTVTIVQAHNPLLKDSPAIQDKEMEFDSETSVHSIDFLSNGVDVGKYDVEFKSSLNDPEQGKAYSTGGQIPAKIYVTGLIKIDEAEIAVLDGDNGRAESANKLDLSKENVLSLSANHLQKLRLSFKLYSPQDKIFKPHQVFLKLRHETKIEHIFIIGSSANQFEVTLDFLGLVEKLYYLSGKYDLELTIGDSVMENSFLQALGHLDLDLPDAPEKAARPPPQPVDIYLRFGPRPEIAHIFRTPERRPPKELSLAFLGFTLLPLFGFLIGLLRLGVNLKNFPSSTVPASFAILFHAGIAAVLSLYLLFWIKLDLFTTLKVLGVLAVFLVFVGHRTLSHMASTSAKLKSA
ncbi:dolichyl-diphosphooligosaccharide--protein glycosyltransferase subunit 2 [Nymphaea colorata]|nr:dolichyl-diphosphooligosaccharide--protein glycosyltransferase subunit 2 [Nymphaea colorata]